MASKYYQKFGTTALVTGASSGIGKAFAYELAKQGFNLILAARRQELLEQIAAELKSRYKINVRVTPIDLTDSNFMDRVIQATEDVDLGLVVSNAGDGAMGAFLKRSLKDHQHMIALNVTAQMKIMHHFGSVFLQKGRGGIIALSSTASTAGVPYAGGYAGEKAYIMRVGHSLNLELQDTGVHVSILTPGPTATPGLSERDDVDLKKVPAPAMKPETVVKGALKALYQNKPLYIPGLMNKMTDFMGRKLMTRNGYAKMWGMMMSMAVPDSLKIKEKQKKRKISKKLTAILLLPFIMASSVLTISMNAPKIIPAIAPKVDSEANISPKFNFKSNYASILGSNIHYIDEGSGEIVVLVHGNPTSSYLWRNIIPTLAKTHRVIALDLVGMGKSDKPDLDYGYQDHTKYFNAFIESLGLNNITLVLHDWGGALGLDYARKNPDNVKQIAMMEAVTRPMSWDEADLVTKILFQKFRDEKIGYKLIVEDNYFVEKLLPMMSGRKLSKLEMDYYREPYLNQSARKPVRVWPQEIPINETPQRNHIDVSKNYEYLKTSNIAVLFIYGEPGVIYSQNFVSTLKQDIPRATFASIGEGLHYLPETQPQKLSGIISEWINR